MSTFKSFARLQLCRPLAVIDIKATTGCGPVPRRIEEITVLKFLPVGSRSRFSRRLAAGCLDVDNTPSENSKSAGTSGSPAFSSVAESLEEYLRDCDLCGYDLRQSDLPVLLAEFKRARVDFFLTGRALIDMKRLHQLFHAQDLEAVVQQYVSAEWSVAPATLPTAFAKALLLDAQLAHHPCLPRHVSGLHYLLERGDGWMDSPSA